MPTSATQVKQDIDNTLGNKGYKGIRIVNVITTLKSLVDWVQSVYDACTQYASLYGSDGTLTGNRIVNMNSKGLDFRNGTMTVDQSEVMTRQKAWTGFFTASQSTNPIGTQPIADVAGAAQFKSTNGGPAFVSFQRVGYEGVYFGIDTDNRFVCRPWSGGQVSFKFWTEQDFAPSEFRRKTEAISWASLVGMPGFLADPRLSVLRQDQPMWTSAMLSGFYHIYQSSANSVAGYPFSNAANQTCTLINIALSTNVNYAVQVAIDIGSDAVKFRRVVEGTPQNWRSINIT